MLMPKSTSPSSPSASKPRASSPSKTSPPRPRLHAHQHPFFFRRIICIPSRSTTLRSDIYTALAVASVWTAAFIILTPLRYGPDSRVWSAIAAVPLSPGLRHRRPRTRRGRYCPSASLIMRLHASLRRRLLVLFVFLTAFISLGAVAAARFAIIA